MKRVTLTKLHPGISPIQAIKTLRESTRNPHSSTCSMSIKEAKDAVDAIRFDGRTPTVKVEQREVLAAAFEYSVVPNAEYFHATHHDSTILVTDNRPVGSDGYGEELFVEVACGDVPMATYGVLDAREDYESGSLSREQAEHLYDFLGDWLGK